MSRAVPARGRRMHAYAYTLVTTAIVLLFALAEWMAERFVSEHSRAAGTAIEISIVLIAALVFRPVHHRVDEAVDAAFYRRKRQALAALARFRPELSSFDDLHQLLRRVVEAIEHHGEAAAAAVYLRRARFHAEVSSFDVPAEDVALDDPLAVRLRSTGAPANVAPLQSRAVGTHAFPITAAGELIGFMTLAAKDETYDADELQMLAGLAADLAGAIVALEPSLRPRKHAPPNNLPFGLPPLVGRERELAEIDAALSHAKLVTLTGPGGVGKTRLALQCAAETLERYEDGAWFVNLAPIGDGALIVPTVLAALDASGGDDEGETARLLGYLRSRTALVVLDNCEHLVADAAAVVAQIRRECPDVTLLATSREVLHVPGEHVYRLGSLRPEAAAELFTQRATAAAPDFDASRWSDAVRGICDRLDGIPLAIELAAARVRALTPAEILERLHERFRLLTSASRTALPRQQTLAAAIAWSYDLLDPEEQALFRAVAVFRGSFSLEAAAAVCSQGAGCDEFHVLDVLTSLVDKSLVGVTTALATRYRLLETIREFALARSIEVQTGAVAVRHHAAYFAALGAQAYREFDSRQPAGWIETFAPDVDNFRAALSYTLEGSGDRRAGAQLAADCGVVFLRMELLGEGLRWCELARAVDDAPPAVRGRVEYVASMLYNNSRAYPRALEAAERAVEHYRQAPDERGLIRALSQTAHQYARAHRFDEALAPADEAIRRARALGDPHVLMTVLRRCAYALPPADVERARELFDEAAAAARDAGESAQLPYILQWWAGSEAAAGCYERAIDLARRALDGADDDTRMYIESDVTGYALACGKTEIAQAHAGTSLTLALNAQHPVLTALATAYCAPLLASREPQQAARVFGYAGARLAELEFEGDETERLALDRALQIIRTQLPAGDLAALVQQGAALTQDRVLALITPVSTLGSGHGPAVDTGDGVGALLG